MSKGNVLLGMSRGKLGDLVLTRGAGEQIARARNRHPKNPQTTKQMAQRAALATLVEFFVRGRKNLFKFAFESKKPGESDYNAFVRANMGIVPVQSSKTLKENGPVFGEFVISQGSLTAPEIIFSVDCDNGGLGVSPLPGGADDLTIGQLSQAIAEKNGLQNGDIITLVFISAFGSSLNTNIDEAITDKTLASLGYPQSWVIRQFTLDFNSTALARTLPFFDNGSFAAGEDIVEFNVLNVGHVSYSLNYPCMVAAIASRVTPSGVKVSTSSLKLSKNTELAAVVGRSDEWKEWVAKNWVEASSLDVAPEDILKGSLSVN